MLGFFSSSGDMDIDPVAQTAVLDKNVKNSDPLIRDLNINTFEPFEPEQYNMQENQDGSITFEVAGQEVTLPADLVNINNDVFVGVETSGVTGNEILVQNIAAMIEKLKVNYPDSPVPLNVTFGKGERIYEHAALADYSSNKIANTFKLQSGNDFMVIQYDSECKGITCKFPGVYKVEGQLDGENGFKADVAVSSNKKEYLGEFAGKMENNTIDGNFVLQQKGLFGNELDYNWVIDYGKPEYSFDI